MNSITKRAGVKTSFSSREVKSVMKSLDADRNGTVEEIEFVRWVQKGMTADAEERQEMAGKTSLATKLDLF
jgi:hypothetical protein